MSAGAGPVDPIVAIRGTGDDLLDLAAVERELAAMWRSAHDRETLPVIRACRTNLIWVGDGEVPDFIDEVVVRHPARLIVVTRAEATDRAAPPLRAHVSALCRRRLDERGGLVCSERVVLVVREGEEERLPSMVRGLAIGELPLVLLGEPEALARHAASGLLATADRVLVDSTGAMPSLWSRLASAPGAPADAPPAPGPAEPGAPAAGLAGGRMIDLAWLRLAELRRVIARAIERSPVRKAIHRLETVDIGHAGLPTAALLLAGWLAYRLHWGWPRRLRAEGRGQPGGDQGQAAAGAGARARGDLHVIDLPARGRRVSLRLGPIADPERLVVLLRAPEAELRVALHASESAASIARGAGRLHLLRPGRGGRARGSRFGGERLELLAPDRSSLVVQALEHAGQCDRDALPVLARARGLAAFLDRSGAE